MKAIKIFAALIISMLLICLQSAALAAKAARDLLSAESIAEALSKSGVLSAHSRLKAPVLLGASWAYPGGGSEGGDAIEDILSAGSLTDALEELLRENAGRLGLDPSKAGETARAVLKTDAAAAFISKYASEALASAIRGGKSDLPDENEIASALKSALDELPADIKSGFDREAAETYIAEAAPAISDGIRSFPGAIESKAGVSPEAAGLLRLALSRTAFAILASLSFVLGLLLVLLFKRSRAGLAWWGASSVIASLPFVLAAPAAAFAAQLSRPAITLLASLMLDKLSLYGFCLLAFGALLLLAYAFLRPSKRRRAGIG